MMICKKVIEYETVFLFYFFKLNIKKVYINIIKMSSVKVIQKNIEAKELNVMLEQILDDKGDPEIVESKKKSMVKSISYITKLFSAITQKTNPETNTPNGIFRKCYNDSYNKWLDEIDTFNNQCKELLEKNVEYSELKDHKLVKVIIFICRDLKPFAFYIENQGTKEMESFGYKGAWISDHPGSILAPFTFSEFNLKAIWRNPLTDDRMKKYLLTLIKSIFITCNEIYKLISSPDIDISQFSKIIVESIQKIKSVPELNRCKKAFSKLEESVELLEGNFGEYYKDMVQSQNPTMLIVNFINDVSKTDKMDIGLVTQFRQIVNYYRKTTQGKIKDPAIRKKFEMLSSRFNALDEQVTKMTGGKVDVPESEQTKSEDSSDTEEEKNTEEQTSTSTSEAKSD